MNDFFEFIDKLSDRSKIHVEIDYSHIIDWCIYVYKKDCASDYPGTPCRGNNAVLCAVQSNDLKYAFAKAQTEIKDWLLKFEGGY